MKVWEKQQEYLSQRTKMQQEVEKKLTFRKNFLRISISMLLVILLGFGFVYDTVKDIIIQQNIQMSLQAFSQAQSQFDEADHTANTIATQVMLDDICSEFLNASSGRNMNSIFINKVRNQLSLYQNTNPTVDSIYIYNRAADLFICSGSRFKTAGVADFADTGILQIIGEPDAYYSQSLIPRKRISRKLNQSEEQEMLYSYLLFTPKDPEGNIVVVNMKFDSMIHEILQMEFMKDSTMVIIDEKEERLVQQYTMELEESPKLKETVKRMVLEGEEYQEYAEDGQKYGIFYLYSPESEWNYIKVTKWKTIFQTLTELQHRMLVFSFMGVMSVLLISLWISLSIARLHGKLELKYARNTQVKKSDSNILKERFLLDFIHNRKVFSRQSLRSEMEKFGFPVLEGQKFTLLILALENYNKYQETFGKKGTYDIKYGFCNIFEETFGEHFRILGLINRDETMTFILETKEDGLNEIEGCFRKFCENVNVFVPWDFMLFGIGRAENLERIPEMNSQLLTVIGEGFFYPTNTYVTYEEILKAHNQSVDFQTLDVNHIARNLSAGADARETYRSVSEKLMDCPMADYMNAMTWLGISIARGAKKYALSEQEGSTFLLQLAQCKKATETEALFLDLFERISGNQSKSAVKKGVTGKLDEVKQYIEQNFCDPNITLEKLGDEFGVSPNYLGRLFKKDVGMSVADYINAERLKQVLSQLENTERSAKEIAEECGFVSSNYFYTYFRKKIGVTPQVYREQIRGVKTEKQREEEKVLKM